MKKLLFTMLPLTAVAFVMMGADLKSEKVAAPTLKHCSGYTVIEAGLGLDCHGDTVKLIKTHGYYELASR